MNTHRERACDRVEADMDFMDKIGGTASAHWSACVDVVLPSVKLLVAFEG